jgi:hypothetical protein
LFAGELRFEIGKKKGGEHFRFAALLLFQLRSSRTSHALTIRRVMRVSRRMWPSLPSMS